MQELLIGVWRFSGNDRIESNEKSRSANKNVIKGLMVKARDSMEKGYNKIIIDEVNTSIKR